VSLAATDSADDNGALWQRTTTAETGVEAIASTAVSRVLGLLEDENLTQREASLRFNASAATRLHCSQP